jgi:malate synthase
VLDRTAPLAQGSHVDSTGYAVVNGKLVVTLKSGKATGLKKDKRLVGYQGDAANPTSVLLEHNGLHLDIRINRKTPIGATDPAGVSDLVLEAALSTILDLEDSVAVVDAQDKVLAYSNWLGILKGTLTEDVSKGGTTFKRGLNPDRVYTSPQGGEVKLHGRSLMFVRNVGHLMTNPAILYTAADGSTKKFPKASWTPSSRRRSRCTTCKAMARTGFVTHAPAASTSSNPRCTAPPKWPLPPSCSPAWKRCWA